MFQNVIYLASYVYAKVYTEIGVTSIGGDDYRQNLQKAELPNNSETNCIKSMPIQRVIFATFDASRTSRIKQDTISHYQWTTCFNKENKRVAALTILPSAELN